MIVDLSAANLVSIVAERTYNAIAHAWTLHGLEGGEAREGEAARDSTGDPHIVITGGRTGLAIAKELDLAIHRGIASNPALSEKKVHIWFSDERFVESESEDRSDTPLMAGFSRAASRCIFHRVAFPSECTLDEAAARYAAELDNYFADPAQDSAERPKFVATILSMGEDGHIASLFPGDSRALNSSLSALAVDNSPKPPAQRVSIGVARLAASSAIYIFAVGESKSEPLRETIEGTNAGPISMVRGKFAGNQFYLVTDIRL